MLSADISQNIPEFVSVNVLSSAEYASSVLVEPTTIEDWHFMSIFGEFFEQGGLLSQVSLIYPDQILTLRVGVKDRVSVRVIEAKGSLSNSRINSVPSILPDVSFDTINSRSNHTHEDIASPPCLLLIQDTEIIVSPKARSTWSKPFRLIPSDMDWGNSLEALSGVTKREAFNVEPGCILVHNDQWPFESMWAEIKSKKSASDEKRVVRVMTSVQIPPHDAGTLIVN